MLVEETTPFGPAACAGPPVVGGVNTVLRAEPFGFFLRFRFFETGTVDCAATGSEIGDPCEGADVSWILTAGSLTSIGTSFTFSGVGCYSGVSLLGIVFVETSGEALKSSSNCRICSLEVLVEVGALSVDWAPAAFPEERWNSSPPVS